MTTRTSDFVVVGAGIIGLTVAREITRRRLGTVTILEKESEVGEHSSGRNSGVLHAGIYYGTDTLKAQVCSEGSRKMQAYAEEKGIACRRNGKVIVATTPSTTPQIDVLLRRARDNGIRAERIDADELRRIEPEATTHEWALHSPDTAIIDSKAVLRGLVDDVGLAGVSVSTNQCVASVRPERAELSTPSGRLSYGFLINTAGLHADRIAHQMGVGRAYTILPFKGLYRQLRQPFAARFRGSVYPAPDLRMPFLGVHITPSVSGEVLVGPTAIPAFGRENYGWLKGIEPYQAGRMLGTIGMMLAHNRQGMRALVSEEGRRYSARGFLKATRALAPGAEHGDIGPVVKVGLRAQLVSRRSKLLVTDFVLEDGPKSVHVLNAISPAFTSAFSLADRIVDRVEHMAR